MSGREDEHAPLRAVARPASDVRLEAHDLARLEVVSSKPASYVLADRWLAAMVPHENGPAGFPQRFEKARLNLANVDARRFAGRRRAHFVSAARRKREVDCTGVPFDAPQAAKLLVDLAGAGAVLIGTVPEGVSSLIGEELAEVIESGLRRDMRDALERERHSIELRRIVHRQHSAHHALAAVAEATGHPVAWRPSVSVLLSTIRPDDVSFAVEQVARQSWEPLELLCGLHGFQLPEDTRARLEGLLPNVRFVEVSRDRNLGQALQELADLADGDLVCKWDDDDWYCRDHVEDLVDAMRHSTADIVGKAAEFVYLSSIDVTIRRFATGAESWSTTIGGGTLMLRAATLRDVGGWPVVPRRVDRLLIEAIEQHDGAVYRTHGLGYVLRREAHANRHTWQVEDDYFLAQAVEQRAGLDLSFAGVES